MNVSPSTYRVLSVGFENEILLALRQQFDVRCAIAQDSSAEIDWNSLHLMMLPHHAPSFSSEMQDCFQTIKTHYLQFNDINSRRFYYITGRESETYNAFVLTFYIIYQLLKKHQINLVIHANIPHEGFDFILYQVASFLKIKTILCYQSLFANRFWLTQQIENFGKLTQSPQIFAREATNYSLPKTWFYMQGSQQDAAYNLKLAAWEILRKPHRLPPALIRYVYAHQFRQQVKVLTKTPIQGEKYIYFPLHLQPELTTSALGGDYADQMLAIETLSAWLPEDYVIYLKENPKQTEKQRGRLFYKRLAALKNIKLLARNENSISLIQGSIGVATVTGTAGWEALFYGKPVLIFGLAWYRDFSGVTEFSWSLPFSKFIHNIPPQPNEIASELDVALQKAGKGVVDITYQRLVEDFSSQRNATQIVESLIKYLELTTNESSIL